MMDSYAALIVTVLLLGLGIGFFLGGLWRMVKSAWRLSGIVDDDVLWEAECRESRELVMRIGRILRRR